MHLSWVAHPIPKWELGKSEHWMILAVTRFAFKSNFFAGWCFSEKSAMKWQILKHGSLMFKSFFLRWAELFWHLESHSFGVLFCFVFCIFVMLLLGAGMGEARGFKIQQGIAESQRLVELAQVFDCQDKDPKEMETFWDTGAQSYIDVRHALTRLHIDITY